MIFALAVRAAGGGIVPVVAVLELTWVFAAVIGYVALCLGDEPGAAL